MKNLKTNPPNGEKIKFLRSTKIRFAAIFAFIALACTAVFSTTVSAGPLEDLFSGVSKGAAAIFNLTQPKASSTVSRIVVEETNFEAQTAINSLVEARRGHTATDLGDGKILIVGGNQTGAATAEILTSGDTPASTTIDPTCVDQTGTHTLCLPVTGQTATLLADGTVLIVGGQDAAGAATQRAVVFNPSNNQFSEAAFSLLNPRSGQTATLLADGKILIAGGDQTRSAEIIDPATGAVSYAAGEMNAARFNHAAVLMPNGKVLLVGGTDAAGQKSETAEIFNPSFDAENPAFTPVGNTLAQPRVQPLLRVLPDGKVQIIGGSGDESMEVYNPAEYGGIFGAHAHLIPEADSEHATLLKADILSAPSRAALIRAGSTDAQLDRGNYTVTEVSGNKALVAGGNNSNGALDTISVFNSSEATISTDKLDYQPGQTAVLRGTGWLPGETVRIIIHEDPHTHTERRLSPVADADGNFTANYSVEQHDLSVKFIIGAKGATSLRTAQTSFTDAVNISFFAADCSTAPTLSGTPSLPTYNFGNGVCAKMSGLGNDIHYTSWISPVGSTAFTGASVNNGSSSDVKTPNAAGIWIFKVYSNPERTTEVASAQFRVSAFTGKLVFTNSAFSVVANTCSPALKIQLQNSGGTPVSNLSFPTTVALSSNSGGTKAFYSDSSCTTVVSSIQIPANSSDTPNFYYKDSAIGSPLLTGSSSGLTSATQTETITAACSNASVTTQPTNQTITYGAASVSFTAAASGTPAPSIQWQASTNGGPFTNLSNVAPYSGATTGTLTITNPAVALNNIQYRAVFSNACNTVNSNAATLTVNKAVPTVTWNNPADITYGTALGATQLNATASVDGTFNYTPAGGTILNAGANQTLSVVFTPTDSANYESASKNVVINVTPKGLTPNITADNKVYDGNNSAVILTRTLTGVVGLDDVALSGGTATFADANAGAGKTVTAGGLSLTGAKAGNYALSSTSATTTANIEKANLTVTAANKSRGYGAENPAFTYAITGFVNGENETTANVTGAPELSTTATTTDGIGNYSIKVLIGTLSAPNYNFTPVNGSLEITRAVLTVAANNQGKNYGDANPALTFSFTGFVNNDTAANVVTGEPALSTTATAGSGVGTYPITVDSLGTLAAANYTFAASATNGVLTVNARAATIVADGKSKTYGDANPELTATVTGTLNGDTLAYSLSTTATNASGVGSYPIEVALGSNPNYSVTPTNGSLTVQAKTATVAADNKSKTYGDNNPTLGATVTGVLNGETIDYTLATTATNASGVGEYPIAVTLGNNPNYSVTKTDGTLTVTAKTATVGADNASKTYGDDNPALTATVSGVANGDSLSYTLETTAQKFSGAGAYPITVTLGSNPNYSVSKTDGTLNVGARTATVTAEAKSKNYGDDNPSLTAIVSGTVNGDSVNYTLATTAEKTSGVGSYPITVTLGSNPNYELSKVDAALTVNAKAATVTANDKSRSYGDENPALDATVSGLIGSDSLNFTLATAATSASGVGNYPITVTLGSNPNYSVTPTNGTLTVGARTATVTANNKSKSYGDDNPALDAAVTGVVGGDALNFTLATTAVKFSGAGNHPITVTLGSNPNYSVTPADGTLTINARAATVSADHKSRSYGDNNPDLTATVAGLVNGDSLNYSLATTANAASNVGDYPITVTMGSNPNYTVTPSNGTLSVGARAVTVNADHKSKTYGDDNPQLTAVVNGAVNNETINYSLSTIAAKFSGVGDYPIVVTAGVNPNYSVTANNASLTVGAKAATVTANNKSKSYGDDNPALDAIVAGTLNGDSLNFTLATAAVKFSNAGNYPIAVSLGSNPNYSIVPTNGTLTINAKSATVTAEAKSKNYGDDNPSLTAIVAGTVNGEAINYSLSTTAAKFSGVGEYPISVTLGSNPNYNVTTTAGALTVNAKTATVAANNKSKTYGDANPALDAVVTGAVNGDTISFSLSTTATNTSGVGTYPIAVALGSNPNYSVTKTDGTLTVGAKNVTVAANAKARYYGEANPALNATVTGAVNGDAINFTLATTAVAGSNAGLYPIAVTLGSNPNYNVTKTDSILTINPDPTEITFDAKTSGADFDCADNNYKATLKDKITNQGVEGVDLKMYIGSQQLTAKTNSSGEAIFPFILNQTPNAVVQKVEMLSTFNWTDGNRVAPTAAQRSFTIVPSSNIGPGIDATSLYTGSLYFWTTSATSSTATLTLSATVMDKSSCPGDITKANVSFQISTGGSFTPISSAQNLPVGLVDPANPSIGAASAISQYNIGNSASTTVMIRVVVGGQYNLNTTAYDVPVTISKASQTNSLSGGGRFRFSDNLPFAASGLLGTSLFGSSEFGSQVTYNKSGTNPQGQVTVTITSCNKPNGEIEANCDQNTPQKWHKYFIKSNSISELTLIAGGSASFGSKTNVYEQLADGSKTGLDGGGTMQLVFTPYTKQMPAGMFTSTAPGTSTGVCNNQSGCASVVIYRSSGAGGGVWYSSAWGQAPPNTAPRTYLKKVAPGGNVVVQ